MEDWKECKLGEVISFKNGKKRNNTEGCFPIYGGNGILGYSNETNYENCVIIGRVGAYCGSVFYEKSSCWVSDNAISAIPKEGFNTQFCYYLLSQLQLNKRCIGTGQPLLTQEILNRITVTLPPLPTQQKIAQILSSLDDKIELNNKINANLEQQAQNIFKSWFVDFEPFGGEMPAGWKVGILSDVAKLSAGGDKPKETNDKKNEVYNIPIYSNGLDNFGLYGFTNKATIFEESVTVSARGTIGFVCLRTMPYVPIVRLVSVIPKCTNVSAKYLYLSLRNKNIAGTGTTQQQLTVPAFSKEDILIPTEEDMISFTNLVQPMFSEIFELRTENEKLSNLRDTLLPKLMNGEIEI